MTPRRWALLALALVGAGVALVWQAEDPPAPAAKDAGTRAVVDTAANCAAVRTAYLTALAPLQRCDRDDECIADRREGVLSGLAGCVRYRRIDAGLDPVDAIASEWVTRGCAHAFMTCAPRRARCVQHACEERPPEGVPPTWRRYEHQSRRMPGTGFSMFVPPDYGDVDRMMKDGEGGHFAGERLSFEFDAYAPFREAATNEGEVGLAREESVVNGRLAVFQTIRTKDGRIFSSVHFALSAEDAGQPLALTIFAVCSDVDACSDVWTIGRSVEID